jgi:hypothetical protein
MASNEHAILTNNPLVKEFYDNSQSNIVRINDDKLKVILLEHKDSISKNSNYLTPLTLLISFVLTYCTTEFKEFLKIPANTWQGFYFSCGLASLIWLILEVRRIKKIVSVDDLICKIKNQNTTEQSPS